MKPTLYNYELHMEYGDPAKPFVERHYFQTFGQAAYTLLVQGMHITDHQEMARAAAIQTIGTIKVADHYEPLLSATTHPLLPGKEPPKAGFKITYHAGTLADLGKQLEATLDGFTTFHERRNYLWLAAYNKQESVTVDFDPAIFKLQDNLAGKARQLGAYQFVIEKDLNDGYQTPIHRAKQLYHFENGLWALWGLTRHPYLDEANWAPFTEMTNPAQLTILGPQEVKLAQSRLVAHNDPVRHLYPDAGLYLNFPAGLAAYLREHAPGLEISAPLSGVGEALLLTNISTDNQRLIPTPAYFDLQYQLSIELGNQLAPKHGGYYIEFAYLPTRIPVDNPNATPFSIVREFPDTFRAGLAQLQAKALQVADRTTAIKTMQDEYLVHATMYDSEKQIARLFRNTVAEKDLPPGLYLQINRENMTPNALAKLGVYISESKEILPFNFLLTPIAGPSSPPRKHGDGPRQMLPNDGASRGK